MATHEEPPVTAPQLTGAKRALLERWMRGEAAARPASDAIPRRPADRPAPLSFSQLRLWFLDRFVPGSPAYNIPVALRLTGPLDVPSLAGSLDEIVRRHEILRTTFAAGDGEPEQVVAAKGRVRLAHVDLGGLATGSHGDEVARLVAEEAGRAFDLERGPLFRATLLRLAPREHVLLLTWSHMVADGWSGAVFSRELAALYGALREGRAPDLTALPVQYADFAVWQRGWLQGERLERQLAYWRARIPGATPVLTLPADRQRPAVQSFRGDAVSFRLPAGLVRRLRALGQREQATLFMTLLAGYQALLLRASGQADILVGTPVANRRRPELEGLIGFFANTLVLRTDLSGDPTFRELVGRVRSVTLGAFANQDLPFEKLVEELHPERSTSHNPVFQVMFVLNNTPPPVLELAGGLSMAPLEAHTGASKFDLWLSMAELGEELAGVLEYSADLFDRATAERMVAQLRTLLDGAAAAPDRRLSELPLLDPAERERVVAGWNATATGWPGPPALPALLAAQAARTPDAEAVELEGASLTYRELHARADRLARRLRRLGVGRDVLVAVCAERSLELVVGLLAVLKAGGAYVPVDPTYPADRLAYLLDDARAPVLLTQRRLVARLPAGGPTVVCLEDEAGDAAAGPALGDPDPDDLAYVIYTSGSTGLPKGAMNTHRGVVNRLRWMQAEYGLTAEDRVLQKTPFSFDVSVWEFFWPLLTGARLVLARPEGHRDGRYLVRLIRERGVTTAHFVPSMLRLFLAEQGVETCTGLRRVICSGEALPHELQERFFARLGAELHNLYGPTEAAIDVSSWACRRDTAATTVPIGGPIANTQLHVLDRWCNPQPVGVPGELYIGGVGLARGYHRRPGLTAERFVPDPFAGGPGGRLYRTGDLARRRPDGCIEFLGRLDFQVKLRGIRIELGEIEATLRQHATVHDAVVLARRPAGGDADDQLVAYVLPENRPAVRTAPDLAGSQVARWRDVFDEAYADGGDPADPTFNIASWNSSYTGEPIPAPEMREWVDRRVGTVLALGPRRVVEVGCGTGLLLFGIAPHCERYLGMDVSGSALAYVRRQLDGPEGPLPQVALAAGSAHDLDVLPAGSVDTVVLNSVVQYFPSAAYLDRALEAAARALAPGGRIFVGDVRSLPLLEAFHASVELHRAPGALTTNRLRQRVAARAVQDQELVLDPAYFTGLRARLRRLARVEVRLERGRARNELSAFRYDVVLHMDSAPAPAVEPAWLDWDRDGLDPAGVRRLLAGRPPAVGLTRVPNARLAVEARLRELLDGPAAPGTVAELREAAGAAAGGGVDPEALADLAAELGYELAACWSAEGGPTRFDAVLRRPGTPAVALPLEAAEPDRPHRQLDNRPLQQRLVEELAPAWRAHLRERLPDYMVPAIFVALDELPVNPNGKLDRDALPAPPPVPPGLLDELVAPRTPAEETLARIWAQVLGLEEVGVTQNYFELGGDSIRSIQVVTAAGRAGLELTPRDLFRYPTIAELASAAGAATAELVAPHEDAPAGLSGRDLRRRAELLAAPGIDDVYPLAPFQAEMLGRYLADPSSPGLYLVQRVETMRGDIDVAAFHRAWRQLAERFPILRTSFAWEGLDAPLQLVHSAVELPFAHEDWRGLTEAQRDARLTAHLAADRARGCAPGEPAGLRLLVGQVEERAFRMALSFSYLLVDGWSLGLFTGALLAAYRREATGRGLAPESGPPYRTFVEWVRALRVTPEAEARWRELLAGFPGPTPLLSRLPGNRPGREAGFARQHLYLSASATHDLQAAARRRRLTPSILVQAAWAALLAVHTGEEDVTFGLFVNGRPPEIPGIETLGGPTMNVVPLRVRGLAGGRPAADLMDELMELAGELSRHEHTPLPRLREWAGVAPGQPLFESYMVFQNLDPASFRSMERVPAFFSRMGHPLRVDVFPGVELGLALSYHRHELDDASAARVLADFEAVLQAIATRPERTLADLRTLLANGVRPPNPTLSRIVEGALAGADVETTVVPG